MPYIIGIIILIALIIYLWPAVLTISILFLIYKIFKAVSNSKNNTETLYPTHSLKIPKNSNNMIAPRTNKQRASKRTAFETPTLSTQKIDETKNLSEDRWQISISFRKSASKNFESALFLAKQAPNYIETESNEQIIYQAFFDAKTYSDFELLYKLIKDWKSTFIMLNGEVIDKKSMSKLNRCLGDKVRFKDPNFCFGASPFTENPFGCHRLMITPSQKPWWAYGSYNLKKEWIIDKKQIKEQIMSKSLFYNKCPYFNLSKVLLVIDTLPDKLTYQRNKNDFIFTESGVYKKTNYLEIGL